MAWAVSPGRAEGSRSKFVTDEDAVIPWDDNETWRKNHDQVSPKMIFEYILIFHVNGGKRNGSKDQIKKNGTEEGTFL